MARQGGICTSLNIKSLESAITPRDDSADLLLDELPVYTCEFLIH